MALEQQPAPALGQMAAYIEAASQTVETLSVQLAASLDTLSKLDEFTKDRLNDC